MRDDEVRTRLLEANPWWLAAAASSDPTAWAAEDHLLRGRARHDLGYRSTILDDIATGPLTDQLIVLRGPRRVGKSVILKDTAMALCKRSDVNARQVIYLSTEMMRAKDLSRAILIARELTRPADLPTPRPRVWLFDEITSIDGWTQILKYQRDNTAFADDTVICTGSSWSESADVARDLFAGRAGTTVTRRLRILLPMSFRAFVAITRTELPKPDVVNPWDLQSDEVKATGEKLMVFASVLDLAWQAYLTSGGFPRAVSEFTKDGAVSETFLTDLESWLQRDVDPDAPFDSIPNLLAAIHERSASPLNRTTTADHLGYPSRKVFDLRLNRLTRSFAGLWCHQRDQRGRRVAGAQPKFYLTDPLLAHLGHLRRAGLPAPNMTVLSEAALAVTLAATIERLQAGRWTNGDSIGYSQSQTGTEVDLAPVPVPSPDGVRLTTPIESKWVTQGWKAQSRTITARFGQGIVATKDITDTSGPVWALPAPLVAFLLE